MLNMISKETFINIMNRLESLDNKIDAVIARKNAEEKYFGEYSYKNSMNKGDNLNG